MFLLYIAILSVIQVALACFYDSGSNNDKSAILLFAVILRLVCIFALPCYEDDFYRYLWDGYVLSTGTSPYAFAPENFFLSIDIPEGAEGILDNINNPSLPTIYGPITILFFYLCSLVKTFSIYPLKVCLALIDTVCLMLIKNKVSSRWLILLAWSPLLIFETVVNMHFEVLGVLFILLGLRKNSILSPIFLALSVSVRVYAVLLIPFIIKKSFKSWVIFISSLFCIYLPVLILSGSEFSSLLVFANEWEYNSFLFSIFSGVFGTQNARYTCFITFILLYICILNKYKEDMVPGEVIIGGLLLLSPVINPWYFIWIIYFAALNKTLWPWFICYMLPVSYWHTGVIYEHEVWVRVIQFMPLVLYFIWEGLRLCRIKGKRLVL